MTRKTFDLGYMDDQQAQRVKDALHGKTYMAFEVSMGRAPGPCMGVTISTSYDASDAEILTFALYAMATA